MKLPFIISLGSNLCPAEAEANLTKAEFFLSRLFLSDISFSSHYSSPGVGSGEGKTYVNAVSVGNTSLTKDEIISSLKDFEAQSGRTTESRNLGIVPIDLDLLSLGDTVLKPKDLAQQYVIRGLEEMTVGELDAYTEHDVMDIDLLMQELSPTSHCTAAQLESIVGSRDSHLYVIRCDGHIVASACLCVAHTTEFSLGFVEAVVVSSRYRGKHLGKRIMNHLILEAGRLGVSCLHLTSNPRRVAANALYQSIGFERYETNMYKLNIR